MRLPHLSYCRKLKICSKSITTGSHPSSTVLSIICSHLFCRKIHWFHRVEIRGGPKKRELFFKMVYYVLYYLQF